MLKLLIVDDEYIVRQGMRKILPWEEMDVALAGEAESIEDAVETARRVCPDIVICDICLPGGEGFILIDEIRRIVPWVQFIMITAHVDKEYMLRAIYEEVCDYLFKPAKVEDIKEAVARAHRKVEEFQEKARKAQGYQNFIMENLDILRENYIVSLLHGTICENKAVEDGRALKLYLEGPAYRLLVLRADPVQFYRIMQQISAALGSFRPAAVQLAGTDGDIAVVLNCGVQEDGASLDRQLQGIEAERIWISERTERISGLADFYQKFRTEQRETQKAAQQTFWQEDPEQQEIKETLYEAVKYHDSAEEIRKLFELYFERAEEAAILSLDINGTVIATGGSVIYSDKAMEHLKKLGKIIYLHIDYENMCSRISNLSTRGVLIKNGDTLKDMYNERLPLYQKWADAVIDCNGNSVEQTAREIEKIAKNNT